MSMAGLPTVWLIPSQVRDELLAMRKGDTVDNHFVMACFLVQEGADVNIRNRAAHTPIQLCSSEMSTLMINFVNKNRWANFGMSQSCIFVPVDAWIYRCTGYVYTMEGVQIKGVILHIHDENCAEIIASLWLWPVWKYACWQSVVYS